MEDTRAHRGWRPGLVEGLSVRPLYAQGGHPEQVALVRWEPGTRFQRHTNWRGEEILVLDGNSVTSTAGIRRGPGSAAAHESAHPILRDGMPHLCAGRRALNGLPCLVAELSPSLSPQPSVPRYCNVLRLKVGGLGHYIWRRRCWDR